MSEPHRTDWLLKPGNLVKAATFEDGRELAEKMLAENDGDTLADLMEHAVDKSERAHAVIFYLVAKQRGWPTQTGIDLLR